MLEGKSGPRTLGIVSPHCDGRTVQTWGGGAPSLSPRSEIRPRSRYTSLAIGLQLWKLALVF